MKVLVSLYKSYYFLIFTRVSSYEIEQRKETIIIIIPPLTVTVELDSGKVDIIYSNFVFVSRCKGNPGSNHDCNLPLLDVS